VLARDPHDTTYDEDDLLRPVFDKKPISGVWSADFDTIRKRVNDEWNKAPKKFDPVTPEVHKKIEAWIEKHGYKF
jgi:hypothetical protein